MGLVILRSFLPNRNFIASGFLFGIALAALAPIVSSMQTANKHSYVEQRAVIYKYLKNKKEPSIVLTTVIQKNFGQYLLEFNENGPVQFYDYGALSELEFSPQTAVYILVNGRTKYMPSFSYDALPQYIKDCYERKRQRSIEVIYETEKVALYKLNQPSLLKLKK
jgi:hypothetical protein